MNLKRLQILLTAFVCIHVLSPLTEANELIEVNVRYTNPKFDFDSPLSLGLTDRLPAEANASFLLMGAPTQTVNDYSLADVSSFELTYGDGEATQLESFFMRIRDGQIEDLTYESLPFDSPTASGITMMNFPLTIQGIDFDTHSAFSYTYENSSQSFSVVPEPSMFAIDMGFGLAVTIRRRRAFL